MGRLRNILDRIRGSELDRILKRARRQDHRRFLIYWNRGLGDVALGLSPLFARIRDKLPQVEIHVVTRSDLREVFALVGTDAIFAAPNLRRGPDQTWQEAFASARVDASAYDVVLTRPDPTRWLAHSPVTAPRLQWQSSWDALADSFDLDPALTWIAAHISSETGHFYGYVKDWPFDKWRQLIGELTSKHCCGVLLLGNEQTARLDLPRVVDLRGRTGFLQMLSVIKQHCRVLVAPDSGILSCIYYVDAQFPLTVVSLWADPRQGVLKRRTASPNRLLTHIPLLGRDEQIANISVEQVLDPIAHALQIRDRPAEMQR